MKMEGNWVEVRKLNGEMQKRIQRDKKNYVTKKCKALENQKNKYRFAKKKSRDRQHRKGQNNEKLEYTEDLYKKDPNISGKSIYTGTISDKK